MFGALETAVTARYGDAAARLTRLLHEPALNDASQAAYDAGQKVLLTIGPFGAVPGLSKLVRVSFLEPREDDGTLSVALRWEATGPTGVLFPVLDADLSLIPADSPARTRLRLLYSYRPPLGRLGAAVDSAVLGKVATATVRSLLDDLAGLLADGPTGER